MSELTLGQRIAQERKNLNLSQEALGERLGVSRQAISKWESDGAVPELDKLIALSRLFSTDLNGLLGVDTAPPESEPPAQEAPPPKKRRFQKKHLLWLIPVVICGYFQLEVVRLYNLNETAQIENLVLSGKVHALEERTAELERQQEKALLPGALASDYAFDLELHEHAPKVTVLFSAVPYAWQSGDSASLHIQGRGIPPMQLPCQWDGAFLSAATVLDMADGYELCLAIEHADGSRQMQILEDPVLQDLAASFSLRVSGSVQSAMYRPLNNALLLQELRLEHDRSDRYEGTPVVWKEVLLTLSDDGEEVATLHLSDLGGSGDFGQLYRRECMFPLGQYHPQAGQTLTLSLYARLSNGLTAEAAIGSWRFKEGDFLSPIGP